MRRIAALRLAAWLIAIVLVALPVVAVLRGSFAASRWPVRELHVHAQFQHVSAAEVRAAAAPLLGAGFFAIDLARLRDAVAALPWVAQVEVSKRWPDALDITVSEIQPFAHWGDAALLDASGRIFKVPNAEAVTGLPRFDAPADRADEALDFYRRARADFAAYGWGVTSVRLSARGSWALQLSNGAQVVVGSERPQQRLTRFAGVLPVLMRGRAAGFAYADLRYSNGVAVRWPEAAANPPAATPRMGKG